MSTADSAIEIWLSHVDATPPPEDFDHDVDQYAQEQSRRPDRGALKRKRRRVSSMADNDGRVARMEIDEEQDGPPTERPRKRQRDAVGNLRFDPSTSSHGGSDISSHQSGRMSPTKQMQALLHDTKAPVVFASFDDESIGMSPDVCDMRLALQQLADGIGILDAAVLESPAFSTLAPCDQLRLRYATAARGASASDPLGSTPPLDTLLRLVKAALQVDRSTVMHEIDWNEKIHLKVLELALHSSAHANTVDLCNVKTATITPKSLTRGDLPGRVVDYTYALLPDDHLKQAWKKLEPLPPDRISSWNHTAKVQEEVIAVNIETKDSTKSWTDGRPQLAIWVGALLQRLRLLWEQRRLQTKEQTAFDPPVMPIIIAQGHDWYVLLLKYNSERTVVWQVIFAGNTRDVYDLLRLVAMLHWCIDWAESVWRKWFQERLLPP